MWGVSRSRTRVTLGSIRRHDGVGFRETIQERFAELAHGRQGLVINKRAHPLPPPAFTPQLRPDRLEQRPTPLLGLLHSARQHPQRGKHDRKMLLTVTVVGLQVVAVVL